MYIGPRKVQFKEQPRSLCHAALSLLAAVAVGFLFPAHQAAQSAPPSASTPHAQRPAQSQTRHSNSQTIRPHTTSKKHQASGYQTGVHHTGARPANGKSAGAQSATGRSGRGKLAAAKGAPAKSAIKSGGTKSGKKRSSSKNAHLSSSQARRIYMAHLHPGTDRITAIQQKLADVGYLKEEPNGQWDDLTREAMRRYQEDNGFPATGLPEAKSLMKLGLGPHPLPPELDRPHTTAANASPPESR